MKRINFKIDTEKKEEITQYVEENNEYSSVSHFLRLAANKEMSEEEQQVAQIPPRVTRTLDEIVGELDELRQGIDNLAAEIDKDDNDLEVLAQRVYETIPVAPVANSAEAVASGTSVQQLDQRHAHMVLAETAAPSTISELAQALERDREDIKDAIHHLKSNFLPVLEIMDDDGNKHFLRQEERK